MVLTMADTKVISAVVDVSSQKCYICGSKPSEMNDLRRVGNLSVHEDYLKYGLSILHAWIKLLECLLHIAYKLEFQKGSVRGASSEERQSIKERKTDIQKAIWKDLGLKVDRVVQGRGTSNAGNVARKFFQNAEKAAEATGLDLDLIKRFGVILQALLCLGHEIDAERFDKFAFETAELYVSLYGWYPMPPSVHKILIHGSQAIKCAILPIGRLSEEAQESRNKDYRRFQEHHTRKTTRIDTTTDLLNRFLVSSDPVITSHRTSKTSKLTELDPAARELLVIPSDETSIFDETSDLNFPDLE